MEFSASQLFREAQGCKLAYVQSDEASFLLTDWDELTTEAWFGNNLQKITSISAAVMTAAFNQVAQIRFYKESVSFDARSFQIPREEISNYFLWRAHDWKRNSIQMYARSVFSHKELHKKSTEDMLAMLEMKGLRWGDLTPQLKNGTWIYLDNGQISLDYAVTPEYTEIDKFVRRVLPKDS